MSNETQRSTDAESGDKTTGSTDGFDSLLPAVRRVRSAVTAVAHGIPSAVVERPRSSTPRRPGCACSGAMSVARFAPAKSLRRPSGSSNRGQSPSASTARTSSRSAAVPRGSIRSRVPSVV
ncbi:hypothetical protein BRD22_04505 [Halobacteriales archaeon SW_8_68_21]|nr:MAG: hypothetical protein BRD22_04505 [Halobacteriales archaeon SW_8_68_21]